MSNSTFEPTAAPSLGEYGLGDNDPLSGKTVLALSLATITPMLTTCLLAKKGVSSMLNFLIHTTSFFIAALTAVDLAFVLNRSLAEAETGDSHLFWAGTGIAEYLVVLGFCAALSKCFFPSQWKKSQDGAQLNQSLLEQPSTENRSSCFSGWSIFPSKKEIEPATTLENKL